MDFAENFESYKSINEDAYSIMCASIDFSKFKDQILKFKLSAKPDDSDNVKQNFGATGADKFFELASEDFSDPKLKWAKVIDMKYEKDGFSGFAYRRPLNNGSSASMMMTEMRYLNCKKEWFLELMKNGPPTDNMKREVLKENDPNDKYIYVRVKLGGFVSDRDTVVHKTQKDMEDGSTFMTIESAEYEGVPENPGVLRMEMFKTMKLR